MVVDWKLNIPPKIKLFIWKCAHHRIPTKSLIFPHADLNTQMCPCCNEIEMPIHILRDCTFARNIWSPFSSHWLISDFFRLELHNWCKHNSKVILPSSYIPCNIIFAFTIWVIWLGWNSLVFIGRFIPHDILQKNAISHATEFFFLSSIPAWHPFPSSNTSIRWRPALFLMLQSTSPEARKKTQVCTVQVVWHVRLLENGCGVSP